jgi:ABC-type transport system substrate-binding protein
VKRLSVALAVSLAATFVHAASEIHIGIAKPPAYYDPRAAADSVSHSVLSQVYETPLLYTSSEPNGAPNLFASVQKVDNKTYVGTLTFGITFSDGEPLTAANMAAWLSTVPGMASRATLTAGREGQNQTVTFHLKEPDQYFSTLLMMNFSAVAKEKARGVWVGTGPFVLGSHDEKTIVLEKNPRYHEVGLPKADRLVFKVYPAEPDGTNPKLIEAIRKGEVDFTEALPLSVIPELQAIRGAGSVVMESTNTGWISFNVRRPPLDSSRVRRALASLVSADEIVRRLYPVGTRRASSFLPPALASQVKGVNFDVNVPFEPARGKAELAALGYGPSKKLKLSLLIPWTSRPYCNNPVLFGGLVKKDLESSGAVEVSIVQPATGEEYFQALLKAKFDLAGNGWIADGPNPADFVEANFSSSKIGCLSNCNNIAGWSNARVDRAIRDLRATGSTAGFQTLVEEFRKDLPVLPIVHGPGVLVISRRLHGVEPSTFSYISFRAAAIGGP